MSRRKELHFESVLPERTVPVYRKEAAREASDIVGRIGFEVSFEAGHLERVSCHQFGHRDRHWGGHHPSVRETREEGSHPRMVEVGVREERRVEVRGRGARILGRVARGQSVIEEDRATLVTDDESERADLGGTSQELNLHSVGNLGVGFNACLGNGRWWPEG